MKSVKVTILGKQYPLKVEDSEEETIKRIARYVDDKFRQYKQELNKQPDTTVMSLAALAIAEELFEERKQNRELNQQEEKVMKEVNESLDDFVDEITS
ncbi:cell division protein ZapA [Fodinibius roseus]|uniref:Cell division protein ZapA n=1 Tax=Fodinibius roseus TaxID=1194090 RepID=A0A1M5C150_9BACT|nr:cell division protein ZapA [Fodinibius roseus]SHF48390.1 cell division protein ZapA [Fodinibius roseus]